MERKIVFSEGEYYHIYNRGVEKRNVFLTQEDHERFIKLLYLANSEKAFIFRLVQGLPLYKIDRGEVLCSIGAYVLMPNHFHILLRETKEGGISRFMEKLMTGYSMYFNKRHERVGPLFQGRFKARHVEQDEYLKYLFAYIHLNPVKLIEPRWKETKIEDRRAAEKYLQNYHYSSYPDLVGEGREERAILSLSEFPEYFSEKGEFQRYVEDWTSYGEMG